MIKYYPTYFSFSKEDEVVEISIETDEYDISEKNINLVRLERTNENMVKKPCSSLNEVVKLKSDTKLNITYLEVVNNQKFNDLLNKCSVNKNDRFGIEVSFNSKTNKIADVVNEPKIIIPFFNEKNSDSKNQFILGESESLIYSDFSCDQSVIVYRRDIQCTANFKNISSAPYTLQVVSVTNFVNLENKIEADSILLMPEQDYSLSILVNKDKFPVGNHTVLLNSTISPISGNYQPVSITSKSTFSFLPFSLLISSALIVILISVILYKLVKSYINYRKPK